MYVYRYSKFSMSSSILLHCHTTHPQTIDGLPPYPLITLKAPIYYILYIDLADSAHLHALKMHGPLKLDLEYSS